MNQSRTLAVVVSVAAVLGGAAAARAASITLSLHYGGPATVPAGSVVAVEVRGDFDTRLAAARFAVTASGNASATVIERSASPTTPGGLTYVSRTRQTPFVSDLPHDLAGTPLDEVLLDMSFDDQPGGSTDGLAPGGDVVVESLQIGVDGAGTVQVSLMGASAAHTYIAVEGPVAELFDSVEIDPSAGSITLRVLSDGDFDDDGDVDLGDYEEFLACLNGPNVTTPPPGCSPQQFAEADLDGDEDCDLADAAAFARRFTGPQ
ncbi:MAG TPA: hypothetical protein VMZ31_14890 [Phycisphaerae bacterium]|nr:hypothetical protein [Phycisphaerae bacterium]